MTTEIAELRASIQLDLMELKRQTADARKEFEDLRKTARAAGAGMDDDLKKLAQSGGNAMRELRASVGRVFEVFTGVSLANVFEQGLVAIKQYAVEASRLAREAEAQERGFQALTQQVGVNAEALVAGLARAADGLMDTGDAMRIATRGLLEGLQPEQLVELMDASRQLAKVWGSDVKSAYESVTEAIATGRSRRLEDVGISLNSEAALKRYAEALNLEVAELSQAQRAQALYAEFVNRSRTAVEAGRQIQQDQIDTLQRLAIAWEDTLEGVGGWLNTQGGVVLDWLRETWESTGELRDALGPLKTIAVGTWETILAVIRPVVSILGDVLGPLLKALGGIATVVFAGMLTSFQQMAAPVIGGLTFLARVIADLRSGQLPNFTAAWHEAAEAMNKQFATASASTSAMSLFGAATETTAQQTRDMAAATDMGRNKLADAGAQAGVSAKALKQVESAVSGIADAFRALSSEAARGVLPPDMLASLSDPLDKFLEQMQQKLGAAGVDPAAIAALTGSLTNLRNELVEQVRAHRLATEEAEAYYAGLREGHVAAAQSYEAAQNATENLKKAREDEILVDSQAYYAELAAKIDAASKSYDANRARLEALEAPNRAFLEQLASIDRQAALLGPTYDAASARLDAFQRRILELQAIQNPTGEILTEIDQLKAKFADTRTFVEWRDTFEGIFSSVGNAINTLVQGVILGTTTMGDAFKRLGQSIVIEFVNTVIQGALKPLMQTAATVVASLFAPSGAAAGAAPLGNSLLAAFGGVGGVAGIGGASGAGGFSIPNVASGIGLLGNISSLGLGLWGAVGGPGGALGPAFTGIGGLDVLLSGGSLSQSLNVFSSSLTGASSALSTLAGVAGIAIGAFNIGMDLYHGTLTPGSGAMSGAAIGAGIGTLIFPIVGTAIGALIGAAGGALAGSGIVPGLDVGGFRAIGNFLGGPFNQDAMNEWFGTGALGSSLIAGALTGGLAGFFPFLSELFGMFDGKYDIKRLKAATEANTALQQVSAPYQAAFLSGDNAQLLAALSGAAGGPNQNSVRTEFVLPVGLANQIGITGQQIGDKLVAQWSSLTLDQFNQVLQAFREQPDLIQQLRGSGDVPYLEGGDAAQVAEQIKQAAIALLEGFIALEDVRDKITEHAADLVEAAGKVLPPELADIVAGQFDAVRDRMLAVVGAGLPVEEMQAQLQALDKEMQAWTGLVALYATVEQDIAQRAGDIATQTRGAILGITTMLDAASQAIEDARTRAAAAITPEEALAANLALRQAVLEEEALVVRLVQEIQAKIASLLQNVGAPAAANQIAAATELMRQGDATAFNEVYASFVNMARHAPTAAEKLFAISQGIAAVIAAAPLNAEFLQNGWQLHTAGSSGAGEDVIAFRIWQDLVTQAEPFMTELAGMIGTALANDDLEGAITLLQQEAQAIQALGAAAIAAVNQWATAAIEETNKAAAALAADINKHWDLEVKRINDEADAKVKGYEDAITAREQEIVAIQKLAKAEQERIAVVVAGLQVQQRGLLDAAARVRAFEDAAKGFGDFVRDLEFQGLRPEEQLATAQARFDDLMARAGLGADAQLLGDLQAAARQLLDVSGGDAAIRASVLDQLRGVEGTLSLPITSADLEAQAAALGKRIEDLQKESQKVADTAAKQVERLQELNAQAREQITAINTQREQDLQIAEDNRQADLDAIEVWRQAQLDAIDKVRTDMVDAIKKDMADKLLENARQQQEIMGTLIGFQQLQLSRITEGQPLQHFMAQKAKDTVARLEEIRDKIDSYLRSSNPNAIDLTTVPENAAGDWKSTGGLRILHPGEMVVPPTEAEAMRRSVGIPSWQRYLDQAEQLKAERIHTMIYGGLVGRQLKAPMYVGPELSAGFMASYAATPEASRPMLDAWIKGHGWLTPEQANALRGDIAERMGAGPFEDDEMAPARLFGDFDEDEGGGTATRTGSVVNVIVKPREFVTLRLPNGKTLGKIALEDLLELEQSNGGGGVIPEKLIKKGGPTRG